MNTIDVFNEKALVRFHFDDGTCITVHVRDGELRACGSEKIVSRNRKADVVAINTRKSAIRRAAMGASDIIAQLRSK